ncbi:MAG: hypothetical protein IMF14_00880 [Proteobacteria bacterium]|nr:hypothetical protein [Pseudomonadota bacterium]
MLRRLYFLFPDEPHAQRVVDKLLGLDIPERRIHSIARGVELETLPQSTQRQKNDTAYYLEWFFWRANLAVFVLALIASVIALVAGEFIWIMVSLAVMAVTFIAGEQFVVHVPDVHLAEFADALSHGEILLMIDVPSSRVAEIESFVHHRYPEAAVGGVGWSMDAFGI